MTSRKRTQDEQRYVYRWNRPGLPGRKGTICRVTARGKMNSCAVEFEDGFRAVTSRNALRRVERYQVTSKRSVADLSAELLPKGKRKVRVVFRNEQYLCFPGVDNLAEKLDKLAAFAAKQQRTKGK